MREVISALNEALQRNEPVALATVIEVKGASPTQVGFKLLVYPDRSNVGNVGGGALEAQIKEEAYAALHEGCSRVVHCALREEGEDAVGTLCGGDTKVFIEVYQPVPILLIVGGGHIGLPLAEMARIVGFIVKIVDVHQERANVPQLDSAAITSWTYVVLVTEDHITDEQALRQVIDTPAAYIGMIGSRRKVGIIFDHLRAEGISNDRLAQVHAPIGLDLGGRSPAEIAQSIMAEIIKERYSGTG